MIQMKGGEGRWEGVRRETGEEEGRGKKSGLHSGLRALNSERQRKDSLIAYTGDRFFSNAAQWSTFSASWAFSTSTGPGGRRGIGGDGPRSCESKTFLFLAAFVIVPQGWMNT